jgi:CDP-diacylglycerol---serine O-phosphatidyltransferase
VIVHDPPRERRQAPVQPTSPFRDRRLDDRRSRARRVAVQGMRRGVSILACVFTIGNLFAGFWAIILSLQGHYERAAPLIGWAILLDLLDGRIARLTNTTSEFGAELDSLCDVISFGVAPAVLAFAWGFQTMPRVGWLAGFLFVTCGTLRLARFNVQRTVVDGRHFVGLPIPAAAGQVAVWVNFMPSPLAGRTQALLAAAFLVVLSILMVSTFRYWSGKNIDLRSRRSYVTLVGIAVVFVAVAANPSLVLLALGSLYWLSAPVAHAVGLLLRRRPEPTPA